MVDTPLQKDRRLSDAARLIAADPANLAFAGRVAGKWIRKVPSLRDDIESAAYIGLCDAARTFNPAVGRDFQSFARSRVTGEIKESLRQQGVIRGRRHTFAPKVMMLGDMFVKSDDEQVTCEMSVESGELPIGWEIESADYLAWLTRDLPASQRDLIRMRFGECRAANARDAAKIIGVGESRVHQVVKFGCRAIRDGLEGGRLARIEADFPVTRPGTSKAKRSIRKQRKDVLAPRCSKYRGVGWNARTGKWTARLCVGGVYRSLGVFESEEVAARVYDRERAKYPPGDGKPMVLNFPGEAIAS